MVVKRNKSIKKSYKNFRLRKGKSLRLNKKVRKNYKKSKSKSKYSRKNLKGLKNRSRRVRKSKKAIMRGGSQMSSFVQNLFDRNIERHDYVSRYGEPNRPLHSKGNIDNFYKKDSFSHFFICLLFPDQYEPQVPSQVFESIVVPEIMELLEFKITQQKLTDGCNVDIKKIDIINNGHSISPRDLGILGNYKVMHNGPNYAIYPDYLDTVIKKKYNTNRDINIEAQKQIIMRLLQETQDSIFLLQILTKKLIFQNGRYRPRTRTGAET